MLMIHKPLIWPAAAAVQVGVGLDMLLKPSDFRGIYDLYHFSEIPRQAWGWAFVIVGILTIGARFAPHRPSRARLQHTAATACVFAVTFMFGFWASIWASVYLITNEQVSIIPVLIWGFAAFCTAVDAAQHGTSRG